MNRVSTLVAVLLILPGVLLIAGTTGKIAGKVTDAATGEGLAGVNVLVVGTTFGASTDPEGHYTVINIPPGRYDVRARLIGYTSTTYQNLRVVADQTTLQDVTLEASAVELADVVVQAQRPMVQKDLTATMAVVSSEQFELLPVKDFVEVLQLQAGVVGDGGRIYVRGGRSNEVAYLIDGMSVKDPVLGDLGTRVNNDAIQEMTFLSGTFNAEYGDALSGVVNIITKEGGKEFSGQVEARTSQFGVAPYKEYLENRVSASVSGPITGDHLSFFLSGERDARGSWLPFGYDRTQSAIAKVSTRIVPELKAVFTGRYSQNQRQPYNHSWKYIPDQYLRTREYSRQGSVTITHSVMDNLFYDARFSWFSQSYYSGIDKDTSDYLASSYSEYMPIGTGFEFYSKADPVEVTDNRTRTLNLKGDMVWQIGKSNEIKAGVEFKRHILNYFNVYDPKRNFPYITSYTKKPTEGALYVQDKIELNALVANIGLRFDYANQLAPFRSNPLDTRSIVDSKAKTQVSPRIGIAHPISDRTSLHFSYGRFFQNPDYRYFYENSQYDLNVREPLFGQPDLNAQKTTAYEVGLAHQFSAVLSGTFTAYYKDVIGLIGTQFFPPFTSAGRFVGYTVYLNEAYANIRGFELTLTMRRARYLAGSLTYAYSSAKGSASSETEDYPGPTESTLLYPLGFDKPHVLNVSASLAFPNNDGPEILGSRPLENMVLNAVFRLSSGYPYTPSGRDVGFVEKNSARLPATYSLDVEVSKEWKVGSLTLGAFVEMLNVTDRKNVVSVYTDTGEPDFTNEGPDYSQEYIRDPSNYGPPRRIRVGMNLRF
jgi:outer membrane receptor protein involved in Fe transport